MPNRTFVCWACRQARRRPSQTGGSSPGRTPQPVVRCPQCRLPMTELGGRALLPGQDDVRGWAALRRLHEQGNGRSH